MKNKTICAMTIAAGLLGAVAGWQAKSVNQSYDVMPVQEIMKGSQFGDTMMLVHLDNILEKDSCGEFSTAVFVRPAEIAEHIQEGKPIISPTLTYNAKLQTFKALQFGRFPTYIIPTDTNGQNITVGKNYDIDGYMRDNNLYVTHISPSSKK